MNNLIDTHQHLIYRNQCSYDWTSEIPLLSKNDFTINDYQKLTNNLSVVASLFMETGVDDLDYKKEFYFIKYMDSH